MSELPTQSMADTKKDTLAQDEIEFAEKIINYARTQRDYVWVYRAEGVKDPKHMYSAGGEVFRGTWFTPSFSNAQNYSVERSHIPEMKIYALVIPQAMLDARDTMDKGMNQINIINPHLLESKRIVTDAQLVKPTAVDYCSQIGVVKTYADLKNTTVEKLLAEGG